MNINPISVSEDAQGASQPINSWHPPMTFTISSACSSEWFSSACIGKNAAQRHYTAFILPHRALKV